MKFGFGITDLKRIAGIALLAALFLLAPSLSAHAHGVDSANHALMSSTVSAPEQVGSARDPDCADHRGMACCGAGQCISCLAVCPVASRAAHMRALKFAPYAETKSQFLTSLRTRPSNPPPRLPA